MKRRRERSALPPEAERLIARVRGMDSVDEMGMRRMVRDHHVRKNRGIKRCFAIVGDMREKKSEMQCPDPCEHCTTSRSRSDCNGAKGFWYFTIIAAIARPSSGDDDPAANTPIANIIHSCQRWQREVRRLTRMLLSRMHTGEGVRSESIDDINYRIGNYIAIAYLKIAERSAARSKDCTTRDVEEYVVAHFFRVVQRKASETSDHGEREEAIRNAYSRVREVSAGVITRYRIYTEHLNTGNTIALERSNHSEHPKDAYWPRFILISLPQLTRALWRNAPSAFSSRSSSPSSKEIDLIQMHYIKLPERWRRQRRFEFLQLENLTLQCTLYRLRIRDTPAQHELQTSVTLASTLVRSFEYVVEERFGHIADARR
ncbi:hypothetical protein CYMTET_9779 [Cymbomonas tetramitiformis]|uniref:Uncharacterized protein n=1 Tax=Cymbomonas tetramitiformis TaxID=36881 RepID=A0AAE0GQE8_9CHLO|nr:hypothetical protein CYMTET_9779 [Cymbomonas tetramitiformis]